MSDIKRTSDQSSMVEIPLFMFITSGFWCPLWWPIKWKRRYKFYTFFMSFVLALWMISQTIGVAGAIKDIIHLSTIFQSFTFLLGSLCKATNITINREKIVTLLNMFDDDCCQVRDSEELNIHKKYEKICRWTIFIWTIFAIITILFLAMTPFFINSKTRILPFLSYLPYKVDSEFSYWCSYFYECSSVVTVALLSVGNDLLVVSVMIQISIQFDILSHRFVNLAGTNLTTVSDQRDDIRKKLISNIEHHVFIFKLGELTQQCFVATFAFQVIMTLIGSCTSAYLFSRFPIGSSAFTNAFLIASGFIIEAFLYCWFANEVHLKSLEVGEAIYNMNWDNFDATLRKDLLNIAIRSKRPVLFRSAPALPLSNTIFVSIFKASYTAFTLLQRIGIRIPAERFA